MEEFLLESYFHYESLKVRVKILRDHPQISFLGANYGPFYKNQEIEIPRALARILAEEGITEYPFPIITTSELKKKHFQEVMSKMEIKKLEEDFYHQAKDLIYLAEKQIIKEDPKEIKRLIEEICLKRLEKILRIAIFVEDYKKVLPLLTIEERHLLMYLRELIKSWEDNVLRNAFLKKI